MNKMKLAATCFYIVSVLLYIFALVAFLRGSNTGLGWLLLGGGSAMLCLGSVLTQRGKREDEESKP